MRLTCLVSLALVSLVAAYEDDHPQPNKPKDPVEYVDKDGKVYKSSNKHYKDKLDEELHKSYDTDGKEVQSLSEDDYELPKENDLVEHVQEDGKTTPPAPPMGLLPPWLFFPRFFPFGFPANPFYPPPPPPPAGARAPGPPPAGGPPHHTGAPGPPHPPRYLTKIDHPDHDAKERHRRYANELVKRVTVKDDSEWWFDIDGGEENEVTERLNIYPGFATFKKIEEQMDHYAPALHIGTINRGYFNLPQHEQPGDRSFGKGMDFNRDEMDAFRFTPHGQHIALDMYQLEHYLKEGKLPIGRKFIVRKNTVNHYSNCWQNIYTKKIEYTEYVDVFGASARSQYWRRSSCKAFRPGVYVLIGLKKSYEKEDHGYHYGYENKENYVLFLKGTDAHTTGLGYVAIDDFDPLGIQEWSPVHLHTASHKLTDVNEYHGTQFVSEKTSFAQPSVPGLFNHQDTVTGVRIGEEEYKYKHGVPAPYENSIYGTATGYGINAGQVASHGSPATDLHFGYAVQQPHVPHVERQYYYGP